MKIVAALAVMVVIPWLLSRLPVLGIAGLIGGGFGGYLIGRPGPALVWALVAGLVSLCLTLAAPIVFIGVWGVASGASVRESVAAGLALWAQEASALLRGPRVVVDVVALLLGAFLGGWAGPGSE